ncbi:UDP:flavonoid glycosyltransferase YjiC, YdhE family [Noviherbaspirillum humi]|uniref:UDP:flavonoid glycosyltransferase YjiC, YdhE family n=1 Tax=Noviherbaspirillum humi TaxID=1688639 RepID=A0A239L553_9BURK|nr:glycosyltransferase [Noviherbaspirillum humi]SNT24819.1 UDP:flavonoid glycosyltransferase YjiC, YdhE family [Noviherbaspirillum humi]
MADASHVVFATTGSLGDLHPFLAVGGELKRRGHRASIATSAVHRAQVEAAGLEFRHMRPDPENTPAFHARFMHPRTGGEFVYRHYLGPAIRASYADLVQATRGADLLVSQSLMALAAPLVAARTGIPWASAVLQPMCFFSLHERPNYIPLPLLPWLCGRSPALHGKVFGYVRRFTESWMRPVQDFKRELGIDSSGHPMYEGQHSPACVLAMFSPLLGRPQPDWPAPTVQTGTALYQPDDAALPPTVRNFLARGGAPLAVFTLSSAASNDAGGFYRAALAAAQSLGLRALLITGGLAESTAMEPLPPTALRIGYAPFEQVFPHAALIVHSGGSATCFKALQAGKPQVVVPHAHDQLDNALRLRQLGVAKVVTGKRLGRLRAAMRQALADDGMRRHAQALGERSRREDGVSQACDALERMLVHA